MSIRSAVTVSVSRDFLAGPFVFHGDAATAFGTAKSLGFDAVEIFPPDPSALDGGELSRLLASHGLAVAAVGTGAGMVKHGLSLTDADASVRARAAEFIIAVIDRAGAMGAPAIIGSMQGKGVADPAGRAEMLDRLGGALADLGGHARRYGVPLLIEPLNRYETALVRDVATARTLIDAVGGLSANVRILADVFHMNIEEASIPGSIAENAAYLGHVHWADSNRRAMSMGHTDYRGVARALVAGGYAGYVSAEVFPLPDAESAARATITTFRESFARS